MSTIAKHVIVHGHVQGVGFRFFVQRVGTRLGCTRNVSNRPDATVEVFVEGAAHKVEQFLREIAAGPAAARVDRTEVRDAEAGGTYRHFMIEGR